jgi:acetyl esterase
MSFVADLRLRFGAVRLPARVYLPSPSAVPAGGATLVLWLAARNADEALCRDLSATAAAVVLELRGSEGAIGDRHDLAALGWAAEHAGEFGASENPLVVAGQHAGAGRAARLALDARDHGWPPLRRQVLIRPTFPPAASLEAAHVAGAAPAPIVTAGRRQDDGRRYAAALRGAGVEVQELVGGGRPALSACELARALR